MAEAQPGIQDVLVDLSSRFALLEQKCVALQKENAGFKASIGRVSKLSAAGVLDDETPQVPPQSSIARASGCHDDVETGTSKCDTSTNDTSVEARYMPSKSQGSIISLFQKREIDLWPEWQTEPNARLLRRPSVVMLASTFDSGDHSELRAGDLLRDGKCPLLQMMVVNPGCKKRLLWEMMCFILVCYDVIVIPLQVFPIAETQQFWTMNYIAVVFWSCDLVFSFFVGYHEAGMLEMRPRKVALAYVKSFFLLDLFVVVVDWILVGLANREAETLGLARLGKVLRISRALRMLHFLRVLKIFSYIRWIDELLKSEGLRTCLGLGKLTLAIVVVNHYIACIWYALGDHGRHHASTTTWLEVLESRNNDDVTLKYCYTTALHWSLTQFTPASMEVVPTNALERTFTVTVIILALVSFSSFVSSITNAMTDLRRINERKTRQQETVRQYVLQHKLSRELGNQIYSFLRQHRINQQRMLHESDIDVFKFMPEHVRVQLHYEISKPTLVKHPFLDFFFKTHKTGFVNVSHYAVTQVHAPIGHDTLVLGEPAEAMVFVMRGQSKYYHGSKEQSHTIVESGDQVCEMALWFNWIHAGRMTSMTPCDFLRLHTEVFRQITRETCVLEHARRYAESLRQELLCQDPSDILPNGVVAHVCNEVFGIPKETTSPKNIMRRFGVNVAD